MTKTLIQNKRPLHLFDGYGVELEYMIVSADTLNVMPVSDELLKKAAGKIVNEVPRGSFAWSNELALHVIEIKTNGPAVQLNGLGKALQEEVTAMQQLLTPMGSRLMPGAMHPWMDPFTEIRLWPHEYNPIYESYNRIFDCRGHGWANLQSTHLNLPFHGDAEFEKLHAACRLITPLIPALSACSPVADEQNKQFLDYRMEVYRSNSAKIPSITGWVIPEAVYSRDAYYKHVFEPMYKDISPFDPEGILQDEWLNSRGVMSRFDRGAIELRVIDIQECPKADIAILSLTVAAIQAMVDENWSRCSVQKKWDEKDLYRILMDIVKDGERAVIKNSAFLNLFGVDKGEMEAGFLWQQIYDQVKESPVIDEASHEVLEYLFKHGPLGRRILNTLPDAFTRKDLKDVYGRLCDCLDKGEMF